MDRLLQYSEVMLALLHGAPAVIGEASQPALNIFIHVLYARAAKQLPAVLAEPDARHILPETFAKVLTLVPVTAIADSSRAILTWAGAQEEPPDALLRLVHTVDESVSWVSPLLDSYFDSLPQAMQVREGVKWWGSTDIGRAALGVLRSCSAAALAMDSTWPQAKPECVVQVLEHRTVPDMTVALDAWISSCTLTDLCALLRSCQHNSIFTCALDVAQARLGGATESELRCRLKDVEAQFLAASKHKDERIVKLEKELENAKQILNDVRDALRESIG